MITSIRIKPIVNGILLDIQCECGANALEDETTRIRSFEHKVTSQGGSVRAVEPILKCVCGRRYRVVSQSNHFHVFSMTGPQK